MKRVLILIAVALIAGGAVWAQHSLPGTPLEPGQDPFHDFSAVGTSSTEARYSAGTFDSDVDLFIDVNEYNPEIGTFFFLGGYPATDTSVDDTDHLTPMPYALSFGIGKTLSFGYLGIYYGGSFVEAAGGRTGDNDDIPNKGDSVARWNNNLAILLGIANMGFRFDLTEVMGEEEINTEEIVEGADAKKAGTMRTTFGPGVALSWGLQTDKLLPGVQLGFKFPTVFYTDDGDGKTTTDSSGGIFSLKAWTWLALNDTGSSSIWTSLNFAAVFPDDHKGDKDSVKDPYQLGGAWGLNFYIQYKQLVDIGKVELRATPFLDLTFTSDQSGYTTHPSAKDVPKAHTDDLLNLTLGLDLGVKYQHNEKLAFYTGASLDFFNWAILSHGGGEKEKGGLPATIDNSTEWTFTGIEWKGKRWTGDSKLGVGMTITPAPGFVIGTGLNTFLDKLLVIDMEKMQITSGSFWGQDYGNIGSWVGGLFSDLEFDLTVSVKF
jgi:hypothetical protein